MTYTTGTKMIKDIKYDGVLPDWADEKRKISIHKGRVYLLHPDHPPHILNEKTKEFEVAYPSPLC